MRFNSLTGQDQGAPTVTEIAGQLSINVITEIIVDTGITKFVPFTLVIDTGKDLDTLIDSLRAYQYDRDVRADANLPETQDHESWLEND